MYQIFTENFFRKLFLITMKSSQNLLIHISFLNYSWNFEFQHSFLNIVCSVDTPSNIFGLWEKTFFQQSSKSKHRPQTNQSIQRKMEVRISQQQHQFQYSAKSSALLDVQQNSTRRPAEPFYWTSSRPIFLLLPWPQKLMHRAHCLLDVQQRLFFCYWTSSRKKFYWTFSRMVLLDVQQNR